MTGQPTNPDPGQDHGRRSNRTQLTIAIVTALGLIIAALIATKPWVRNHPCSTNLEVTSPTAGQHVSGAQGVEVTGTACGVNNGFTGWLFDYDINDEYYYMDYPTGSRNNAAPIIVGNGGWAYNDAPIGSRGDKNQTYGIAVVLAPPTCTNELKRAKLDAAVDIKFKTFPPGCQVEDTVDVVVTYPRGS
jgi:hypothetical protein